MSQQQEQEEMLHLCLTGFYLRKPVKKQKWRQIETHWSGACGKSIYLRYRGISILIFLSPQRLGVCVFIVGGWWHIVTNQREVFFLKWKKNPTTKKALLFWPLCLHPETPYGVSFGYEVCVCNFSVIYTRSSIYATEIYLTSILQP